jgi:hypothetical protein
LLSPPGVDVGGVGCWEERVTGIALDPERITPAWVIEYRKFSPETDGSEVWDRSFSMHFCVEPGYCPLGELAEGVVE